MTKKIRKEIILILAILFLFLGLRIYGLNWDSFQHLHPDERMLTMVTGGLLIMSMTSFISR